MVAHPPSTGHRRPRPEENDMGDQNTDRAAKGAAKGAGKEAGRPALDKQGDNSVQIAFRVVPGVRRRAKEVADREGLTVSQLSRKALKQYLDTTSAAQ
jgi:hypothetical protein